MTQGQSKYLGLNLWGNTEKIINRDLNDNFIKLDSELFDRGINVKWYGAKGNGTNDDTLAIQNAINAAAANSTGQFSPQPGGGTVIFPQGTYRITGRLVINTRNIQLIGVSYAGSVLLCDSTNAGLTLLPERNNVTNYNLAIVNLSFDSQYKADNALNLTGEELYLQNVWIRKFRKIGMILNSAISSFTDIKITQCETGIQFNNCAQIQLYGANFYDNKTMLDFKGNLSSIHIRDSWFETFDVCLKLFSHKGTGNLIGYNILVTGCHIISGNKQARFAVIGSEDQNSWLLLAPLKVAETTFVLIDSEYLIECVLPSVSNQSNFINVMFIENSSVDGSSPTKAIFKSNTNQIKVLYKDNLTRNGVKKVIDGQGEVTGFDSAALAYIYDNAVVRSNLEFSNASDSVILASNNGTRYKLAVSDRGVISAVRI